MKQIKFTTVGIEEVQPYWTAYGSAMEISLELREADMIRLLDNFSIDEILKYKEFDCSELKEYFKSLEKDCENE